MIRRVVIALMLFSLTSSADAATVIFKSYKTPKNEADKIFNKVYLDGVRDGILSLAAAQQKAGQPPLFCFPGKLVLTVEQTEDIMMRFAQKMSDPDPAPIGVILVYGLRETFPCDEKH